MVQPNPINSSLEIFNNLIYTHKYNSFSITVHSFINNLSIEIVYFVISIFSPIHIIQVKRNKIVSEIEKQ